MVLLLPLVLVLLAFGERIVVGIYGRPYAGNATVIALLALNLLVSAITYPYTRGLFTLEHSKTDMLVNLIALTLLFTVGIGAVRSYASLGAAAALLLSNCVTTVVRIRAFEQKAVSRSEDEHRLLNVA